VSVPPPVIDLQGVTRRFANLTVLDNCSLVAEEGDILSLLGPSGCGKTTLLRCIAGFLQPDAGEIRIDGRDTVPVPVNRRPVGVVFQSYALFPHLTVARNIGYGLRMRGMRARDIVPRVAAALATVSLTGFEDRYPAQLSGGQQQRVAIARVLVLEPRVLLLDEPFSALDAKLRTTMQVELRQLIKRLGLTAIFVTHDQEEALTISDRIAVMHAGRIEQLGTPEEIFDRPRSAYVADFIGASNFWDAVAEDGGVLLPDGQRVPTPERGPVRLMVRPHNLRLGPPGATPWQGSLASCRHVGAMTEYGIATGSGAVLRAVAIREAASGTPAVGEAVSLSLRDAASCMVYPRP
jgi:ABC-type Fe3+/spermidine/putrescine transport system ATPase subunit